MTFVEIDKMKMNFFWYHLLSNFTIFLFLGGANPLALLVAPLAGIALLTAAAAVAINPVLVTVSLTGKRRKRSAMTEDNDEDAAAGYNFDEGISPELEEKIHEMQVKCI